MVIDYQVSIVIFVLSLIIYIWIKLFAIPWYKYRSIAKIPGPKAHWLAGNWEIYSSGVLEMLKSEPEKSKKYGPIYKFWIGPNMPVVVMSEPSAAKVIFQSSKNITKASLYKLISDWLGIGLLTSTGEVWKRKRRLLTPAFHSKILEEYHKVSISQTEKFIEKLYSTNGTKIDITTYLRQLTLDIICVSAFGMNLHAQDATEFTKKYIGAIETFSQELIYRLVNVHYRASPLLYTFTSSYKRYNGALKLLHSTTESVIKARLKEKEEKKN